MLRWLVGFPFACLFVYLFFCSFCFFSSAPFFAALFAGSSVRWFVCVPVASLFVVVRFLSACASVRLFGCLFACLVGTEAS